MIYTCLSNNYNAYKMYGLVLKTKEDFYNNIYNENIEYMLIADSFINEQMQYSELSQFLSNYLRFRNTKIILFGEDIKESIQGCYILSDVVEAQHEIVMKKAVEILQKDSAVATKSVTSHAFKEEFENYILKSNTSVIDDMLFKAYLQYNSIRIRNMLYEMMSDGKKRTTNLHKIQSELDSCNLKIMDMNSKLKIQELDYEKLLEQKTVIENKYDTLCKKIYANNSIPVSILEPAELPENMSAIYFKEISKVPYFDTFVEMLQKRLKTSGNEVSIHIFLPNYAELQAKLYPNYVNTKNITTFDIAVRNTVTVGYDRSILTAIIAQSVYKTIIIVDKTGMNFDIINGNIKKFGIVADLVDNVENIDQEYLISNHTSVMTIPTINNYENGSITTRFAEYNKLPIMDTMLKRLEVK